MSRAMPLPTTLAAMLAVVVAVESARPAAAFAAAARAEQCRGATCGAGDGDETDLFQRRAAVGTLEAPGASAGPVMAVTFEGGGFKALASYAAITSALLKASGEAGSADGLARLFRNVDVIASNSGGTWFQAMAAYSPSFTGVLDDMTYVTSEMAGKRFYDLVLTPFIGALTEARLARGLRMLLGDSRGNATLAKNEDVQESIEGMFNALANYTTGGGVILEGWPDLKPLRDLIVELYEIVQELKFAGRFDNDWDTLVETLLEAGAGISPTSQLGADVLPWAAGKTWLISVTLPTLGGDGVGTCRGEGQEPKSIVCEHWPRHVDSMRVVSNGSDTTSYQARSSLAHQPGQVPARFSLKLGAGVDQEAPQPFCAPGICSSMTMDYATNKGGRATSAPLDFSPFMTPGLLPIASVAAISSAAFGFLTTTAPYLGWENGLVWDIVDVCKMWLVEKCDELGKFLFNALDSDFAMWALFKNADQPVPPSDIFKAGSDLREKLMLGDVSAPQDVLDAMAAGQFMAMYDGGAVDNTAIATAVAGGATEIVAFLDSVSHLWGLFAGAPETESLLPLDAVPLAYINFQVFNETVASAEQQFNDSAQTFHLPPHAEKLSNLQVGTVVATTVDSPYFGISKGKTVTIHAINIDTDVVIGGYRYQDYGVLIKELMQAFERSPEPAKTILDWLAK